MDSATNFLSMILCKGVNLLVAVNHWQVVWDATYPRHPDDQFAIAQSKLSVIPLSMCPLLIPTQSLSAHPFTKINDIAGDFVGLLHLREKIDYFEAIVVTSHLFLVTMVRSIILHLLEHSKLSLFPM